MAEGFARQLGADLLTVSSSGLAPTREVAWETVSVMKVHGVDIAEQYPKKFNPYGSGNFDLIVNLSGFDLPGRPTPPVEEWSVPDPYGGSAAIYRQCATDIEARVQNLVERFRTVSGPPIAP